MSLVRAPYIVLIQSKALFCLLRPLHCASWGTVLGVSDPHPRPTFLDVRFGVSVRVIFTVSERPSMRFYDASVAASVP